MLPDPFPIRTKITYNESHVPHRFSSSSLAIHGLQSIVIRTIDGVQVSEALAVSMYRKMAELQAMDAVLFEAQRQGRFSFYMTTGGEEAVNIASAAALDFSDQVFAQVPCPPFPSTLSKLLRGCAYIVFPTMAVSRARCASMARLHHARVLRPMCGKL